MIRLFSIDIQGVFPAVVPITLSGLTGINIIIGPSGAGKSLLLKTIYSAFLPANTPTGISSENVCGSQPQLITTFLWNNVECKLSSELKAVRGNINTSQICAAESLPEEFILSHEKIHPFFSSSERFLDYKCEEIKNYSSEAVALFQETICNYTNEIEASVSGALESMCKRLPFCLSPVFDWKKVISFDIKHAVEDHSLLADYSYSAVSSGLKKRSMMDFTFALASVNSDDPIFIDDFEAFLDKEQVQYFLEKMCSLNNPFFITTRSAYIVDELQKNDAKIFLADHRWDENRQCKSDWREYANGFLY